jgi:hypothetical protein
VITRKDVLDQTAGVISQVVSLSLCDSQNYPTVQNVHGVGFQISVKDASVLAVALKNVSYRHIYRTLDKAGAYHLKMIDGSLIQMLYTFQSNELSSHRLAVFPSPDLETFQRDPEAYMNDDIFTDIISRPVVPFPIRFDFNSSSSLHKEVDHPKSHLTLGQYQNCRIPVSAPLTPYEFMGFVIRNFYNTSSHCFSKSLSLAGDCFAETITKGECNVPHFRLRAEHRGSTAAVASTALAKPRHNPRKYRRRGK